jgi:hypothetical protein
MDTRRSVPKLPTCPIRLAALVAGCLLMLDASAESKAQPPSAGDTSTLRGKIARFTTAPLGETDGAVLDDGTWLHWPPHMQGRFTAILKEGDRVQANGRTETGPAGDSHFEVQSVTNLRSNDTAENPDYANGPPPPPPGWRGRAALPPPPAARGGAGDVSTVQGKVDRFTSTPRGEVDGAVLDDGTWLHWPPHMQDRFKDMVKEGDRVRATGRPETGPGGDTHFEVQRVTNVRTNANAENPDFANGPPPQPPGRGAAPVRAVDREQRLRDLEAQLQELRLEIQRLRRDR